MADDNSIFPLQNIPESQKDRDWCNRNLMAMLAYQNYTTSFDRERIKDYENYAFYNGNFDTKQFEYITDTYGITSPARLVNHPIIAPKIDVIVGRFMSQPLEFSVEAINEAAVIKKLDKKVAAAAEHLMSEIRTALSEELKINFGEDQEQIPMPENIKKFSKKNGREQVEQLAYIGLKHLIQKYYLEHEFKRGLYDMAITAKSFYHVRIKQGDPYVNRIDPRTIIYDTSSENESIQDSPWVAYERFMTVSEIVDEFSPFLTPQMIGRLESLRYEKQDSIERYNKPYHWYYNTADKSPLRIRVITGYWKSLKMLKVKLSHNKHDPKLPFRKILPDNYKIKKGDHIDKKSYTDIWQSTKIGHDILIDYRSMPNQIRREDNYALAPLPIVGIIKNNFDRVTLSIVDATKNIQLLFNIVMYHIELTLARSGGKSVVYDVSQKPVGLSLDDVFYHAKNSGIIPINTLQEGHQVSSFNQFQQVDFTLSNSIQQLINLKVMLEQTAETLTGISASTTGQARSSAVGVNERNVVQSSLVTQPLISNHTRTMDMVFNQLADLMKIAWGDGERVVSFMGDEGREIMRMMSDFKLFDYSIFIRNGSKDREDKDKIERLGEQILAGSGAEGFLQMIKVMNAANAKDAEIILEMGLETIIESTKQQQEQAQQAQQALSQAQQEETAAENERVKAKIEADINIQSGHDNTLIELKKMDINGGQETQDFRQKHATKMSELNKQQDIEKQEKASQLSIANQENNKV